MPRESRAFLAAQFLQGFAPSTEPCHHSRQINRSILVGALKVSASRWMTRELSAQSRDESKFKIEPLRDGRLLHLLQVFVLGEF